jgi:hypothetical protein
MKTEFNFQLTPTMLLPFVIGLVIGLWLAQRGNSFNNNRIVPGLIIGIGNNINVND